MNYLRSAVLMACGAGIISCVVGSAAVGSSKKAILRLMINCIALISLLSPLTGFDAEDTVNMLEELQGTAYSAEEAEKQLRSYNVRTAELSLELELEKLLESHGIDYIDTVITCDMDEYDVISVSRAEVTVRTKEDADKLKALTEEIKIDFPLTITAAEEQ